MTNAIAQLGFHSTIEFIFFVTSFVSMFAVHYFFHKGLRVKIVWTFYHAFVVGMARGMTRPSRYNHLMTIASIALYAYLGWFWMVGLTLVSTLWCLQYRRFAVQADAIITA